MNVIFRLSIRAALLLILGIGLAVPALARVPSASDLDRVEVGYQAGIIKIEGPDGNVLFVKGEPGQDMRGIDSTEFLPLNDEHRWRIFRALGMWPRELNEDAVSLMNNYDRLPHVKVLAVLGVLGSTPNGHGARISPQVNRRIRHFLASRLTAERNPMVHRMAVLSLALTHGVDRPTVNAVIGFMQGSHNSWETFTTQEFFQYHGREIRRMGMARNVRRRIFASGSPYATTIRI